MPGLFLSREECEKRAGDLAGRCVQYDPLQLLATLAWTNLILPAADSHPAILEYVHHLLLVSPPQTATRLLTEDDFRVLLDDVRQLFMYTMFSKHHQEVPARIEITSSLFSDAVFVRGKSFPYHQFEYIAGLVGLIEDWLPRNKGVLGSDVVNMPHWLFGVLQKQLDMLAERLTSDTTPEESFTPETWLTVFRLVPPDGGIRRVLDLLSAALGSLAKPSSLLPAASRALSRDYPLLKIGADYYCFFAQGVIDELPHIMDGWLKEQDSQRHNSFSRRRETYAVGVALTSLSRALPGARTYQNLFYYPADGKRHETDGLLLYDDIAIIIEAKGAWLTHPARRGYDERLRRDYARLIAEAVQQGLQTTLYLRQTAAAVFTDDHGTTQVALGKMPRKIYLINLVLDAVDPLAVELKEARDTGLLPTTEEWPWIITLNDLRVVAEMLDSPSVFLLYLERRLRFNDHSDWFHVHDELDLLGYFLDKGLFLERQKQKNVKHMWVYDVKLLERYYAAKALGQPPPDKPKPPFDPEIIELVRELERSKIPGLLAVTTELLGLSGKSQKQLISAIKTLPTLLQTRARPQCATFKMNRFGLSFWVTQEWSPLVRDMISTQDQCRKYDNHLDRWLAVIVLIDSDSRQVVDLIAHTDPWMENAEMAKYAQRVRDNKFQARFSGQKIGRNDPCPCGSGKKFKKCHGPFVEDTNNDTF